MRLMPVARLLVSAMLGTAASIGAATPCAITGTHAGSHVHRSPPPNDCRQGVPDCSTPSRDCLSMASCAVPFFGPVVMPLRARPEGELPRWKGSIPSDVSYPPTTPPPRIGE